MAGKVNYWVTLAATFIITNAFVTDTLQPQPILVISKPSDSDPWPEVLYFPDDEGKPLPGIMYGRAYYLPATPKDVSFVLYTSRGPSTGEPLMIGNGTLLERSSFDPHKPTVLVTHGFKSSAMDGSVKDIKNAYVGHHDVNVVTVDWSMIASNIDYFIVMRQTVHVGGIVAQFIQFLDGTSYVNLNNVHLIGHSLGAHVMGNAARAFKMWPMRIGRVTGLDPAGFGYHKSDLTRLDRSDADFVDVIHTCKGWLGMEWSIGHVDFFPNGGGMIQPGCFITREIAGICSHSRAWKYYAESINSDQFMSLPCASYDDFQHNKNCNIQRKAPMGYPVPKWATGNYYLETNKESPFTMG